VVHGEVFEHPNVLLRKAQECLKLFQSEQIGSSKDEERIGTGTAQTWKSPLSGTYKVNWDIALDVKQNRMGVGVLIRDDKGVVVAALCRTVNKKHESAVGEALGALAAVEFNRNTGFFNINPF
jgi:hypothetical protein